MSEQLLDEDAVGFSEGEKLLSKYGSPSYSKLRYYADMGCKSKESGERVYLEWFKRGAEPCTTVQAYKRFLAKVNGWEEK